MGAGEEISDNNRNTEDTEKGQRRRSARVEKYIRRGRTTTEVRAIDSMERDKVRIAESFGAQAKARDKER
jgi:hypothetical protein